MFGVIKEILSDVAAMIAQVAGAAVLLSGIVVCIALASFVSFAVLGDSARGYNTAMGIIKLNGIHINASVRYALELLNWFSLGGIGLLCVGSIARYLKGASTRSRAIKARVYVLASQSVDFTDMSGPTVANL